MIEGFYKCFKCGKKITETKLQKVEYYPYGRKRTAFVCEKCYEKYGKAPSVGIDR